MSLQVQGSSVIVDVTGEAPVVNTQDATLGNNFNARQLTDLPTEGRDPVSILSLQPGVVYIGKTQVDSRTMTAAAALSTVPAATRPTSRSTASTTTTN